MNNNPRHHARLSQSASRQSYHSRPTPLTPGPLLQFRARFLSLFLSLFLFPALASGTTGNAAVAMDADTGLILHLENPETAVGAAFPPGSTIKLFSALYGLQKELIPPHASIRCTGHFSTPNQSLTCWDRSGHGPVNLYKALAYSCNVYFYHYGRRIDAHDYHRFLRTFGFGRKTGVDCPNENPGTLPHAISNTIANTGTNTGTNTGNASLFAGLNPEITVTPLQLLTAFAAIVNGGKLITPHRTPRQTQIRAQLPIRPYLPHLRRGLTQSVAYGTSARFAAVGGIYGKTGTAPWTHGFRSHGWFLGSLKVGNRSVVLVVFRRNGTGAADALPEAQNLVRKWFHKPAQKQQKFSVSLCHLQKPKRITCQGRFGFLTISGPDIPAGYNPTRRQIQLRHTDSGLVALGPPGPQTPRCASVTLTAAPRGFIHLELPGGSGRKGRRSLDYRGPLLIRDNGRHLEIIETVSPPDYIAGVIRAEMGGAAHDPEQAEALKAQAILSRTYAYKNTRRHHRYDFCDSTHCQHYTGSIAVPPPVRRAVTHTARQILTHKGALCSVYYCSTCGGFTNSVQGVWDAVALPYLTAVDDRRRCRVSPHYRWSYPLSPPQLAQRFPSLSPNEPTGLKILETGPGGWIKKIALTAGHPDRPQPKILKTMSGEAFHITMGRRFGWNAVKSANFTIEKEKNSAGEPLLLLRGRGLGHGVGLCQWGARRLAAQGHTAAQILTLYFPGTVIETISPEVP